VLRLKLRTIDKDIDARRAVAVEYTRRFAGSAVKPPVALKPDAHSYNLYTIRLPKRDAVREALTAAQIGTSFCYPQGLHLQDVYRHLGYKPGSLPVCEQASTEALSLPVYPGMPAAHIARVHEVVMQALR
jgi:dTDP-4-amino-4,6-dideoxygalactose transaminase